MFARLGARRKQPNYQENEKDKQLMSYMTIITRLNTKISELSTKAECEKEKRSLLMKEAAALKKANKIVLCRGKLRSVENCDKMYKRLDTMVQRLEDMKYTYEAFLVHTDIMEVCKDVDSVVKNMGVDIDQAQEIVENMQELKDRIEELDGVMEMEEGDDDVVNGLMAELQGMIDEEEKEEAKSRAPLPSVPASISPASTAKKATASSAPAELVLEDDLESMLADL